MLTEHKCFSSCSTNGSHHVARAPLPPTKTRDMTVDSMFESFLHWGPMMKYASTWPQAMQPVTWSCGRHNEENSADETCRPSLEEAMHDAQ